MWATLRKIKNLLHWLHDYFYALVGHLHSVVYRKPPNDYLDYVEQDKNPIILIAGIYERWPFLKKIGDELSQLGHPIYVLNEFGYHTEKIHQLSRRLSEFIESNSLENVVLIGHSKGGLIAKHYLLLHNQDNRVKNTITIAAPFHGSKAAKLTPHGKDELHPTSQIIQDLNQNSEADHQITTIYGEYDNHIWSDNLGRLPQADNIQTEARGHHKILYDQEVVETIKEVLNTAS